ncbi:MAG: NAD+ synthetase [Elusimicrobia bacterium]|nr:NAD+ synthetase [Elusimicrobiota bacterium]
MKLIRVGATAVNQTPLDWDGNLGRAVALLERARREGVSIVCLPELCVTGYGCEDAFHAEFVHETAWEYLEKLVPETKGLIVSAGLPVFHDGALFNSAALICDGRLMGLAAKKFLAGDGIHYEPRWFKPWPAGVAAGLARGGRRVPFGDVLFDCGGIRIGFEICEDAWVSNRPGAALAARGVDLILNPSASHFAFGKQETRRRFVAEGSRAFGAAYVYSNLLGNEAGRVIFDGSTLIASEGRIVAAGPRLGYEDSYLAWADVDVSLNRMNRSRTASFTPDLKSGDPSLVRADFSFPELRPSSVRTSPPPPAWETGPAVKEEEFTRAVALGLFDYLRRSRAEGFVVSLSGGSDSTAVSSLVAVALRLALRELGAEGLRRRLGHIRRLAGLVEPKALVKALLACAYQPTENSGESCRNAAAVVAGALGADFMQWDVGGVVRDYIDTVQKAIGRTLTWEHDDLALQNIQARARGPGVWLLANLRNSILLATSDRSEAAVGYATMDGDTCGGLSPIAGIDKAFLLVWLKWLETAGPEALGPIPELSVVTGMRPTPELRPLAAGQMAESDLMPYDVLDAIERCFIRDKRSPAETLEHVRIAFPKHSEADRRTWVLRFFRLWCRNQWKRERYAPSFHLDDNNLDPKSWCRFPILSSGLEKELAELPKDDVPERRLA